jgi:hypothetical protein
MPDPNGECTIGILAGKLMQIRDLPKITFQLVRATLSASQCPPNGLHRSLAPAPLPGSHNLMPKKRAAEPSPDIPQWRGEAPG